MDKLIITAAMVGAEVTRKNNPNLPLTPGEIASAAKECREAGASMIHLHVRDPQGNPTQDIAVFQETIRLIKDRCDIIVQVSTGGAVGMSADERIQPVRLRPEMATLSTGSVNFGPDIFVNSYPNIEYFAQTMLDYGVKPEIEVFDTGMVDTAKRLIKKGLLKTPLHFDFVMGVPGGIAGTAENLVHLARLIPEGSTWSVAGVGYTQLPLAMMAIAMGGHVRVGFEDNVYYSRGIPAKSNAQLVERIARIAGEAGRETATPDEARRILGLI